MNTNSAENFVQKSSNEFFPKFMNLSKFRSILALFFMINPENIKGNMLTNFENYDFYINKRIEELKKIKSSQNLVDNYLE